MTNSKFGNPDPDWDYNHAWENLIKAHNNLGHLILFITELEDSTTENNEYIVEELQSIQASLNEAKKACHFPKTFANLKLSNE
jgi:hypothetical protein